MKGRKTWTPSFLDHLAKKNRTHEDGSTDRKQYTKIGHHEAIITHDDFLVVQKMIANAKYGNRSFLPTLHVITDGALRGFVSVNPHWAAFSADDYAAASNNVGEIHAKMLHITAKQGDIDLRGSEVVRGDNFVDAYVACVTFHNETFRFSSACVRKFGGVEYVELLVHPTRKLLAVRPCGKEHKNAIRWNVFSHGRAYGRDIGCTACINILYNILDWDFPSKYRLRCTMHKTAGETLAVFDANDGKGPLARKSTNASHAANVRNNYYSRLCRPIIARSRKAGTVATYNPLPDLHPTPENSLKKSVTQITNKMRSDADGT